MSDLPHSYHTFLFPFIWSDNDGITKTEFEKVLSKIHWVHHDSPYELEQTKPAPDTNFISDYGLYQYLTIPARSLIFPDSGSDLVSSYDFRYYGERLIENGKYVIKKTYEKELNGITKKELEEFILRINAIRLKIYNTGIGILVFELVPHQASY